MIYMTGQDNALRVIVLEPESLDRIRAGRPLVTPDRAVLVCFAPDPQWLAEQLVRVPDGDLATIFRLIDTGASRPVKSWVRPADPAAAQPAEAPAGV